MTENAAERSEEMRCVLCPRNCKAERVEGSLGYCRMPNELKVARAALHMWEEPVISGTHGSGTVFFSGCPLGCVFCQNHKIAQGGVGKTVSVERLAEIFFELEEQGANNINLVTPTHYTGLIAQALERVRMEGLKLPVVYNTGGYEKAETLKRLEGLIDVYLPDCKYVSGELSMRYSHVGNYFEIAKKALAEMYRQVGQPQFYRERKQGEETDYRTVVYDGEDGSLIKKGMIVRHLLLPGCAEDSKKVIQYLYETYGDDIYISIMNQFTPLKEQLQSYPELNRKVTEEEYEAVVDYAIELGVEHGFIQEGDTAKESFIPDFEV